MDLLLRETHKTQIRPATPHHIRIYTRVTTREWHLAYSCMCVCTCYTHIHQELNMCVAQKCMCIRTHVISHECECIHIYVGEGISAQAWYLPYIKVLLYEVTSQKCMYTHVYAHVYTHVYANVNLCRLSPQRVQFEIEEDSKWVCTEMTLQNNFPSPPLHQHPSTYICD